MVATEKEPNYKNLYPKCINDSICSLNFPKKKNYFYPESNMFNM